MSEGGFDSAEYTEPGKALPATVLDLYQEALKKRGFERDDTSALPMNLTLTARKPDIA